VALGVAIVVGLVIGLSLGTLGGGGSILTVPALVYLLGQTPQAATTGSLVVVGVSALIGALGHHPSGRVQWGLGLAFGAAGIAAGFLGTALNRMIPADVLLLAFSGLVLVAAAGMVRTARSRARPLVPAAGGGAPAAPVSGATDERWTWGRPAGSSVPVSWSAS
jgi:uncharacterized protein